jgi:hypothetical protein
VDRISDELRGDAALLDHFEELLGRGGYSPAHLEGFRQLCVARKPSELPTELRAAG